MVVRLLCAPTSTRCTWQCPSPCTWSSMSGTVVPPSISVWSNRTVDRACNGAATAPSLQFPHGGSTRRPPAAPGARGGAPAKSRRGDLDRWCLALVASCLRGRRDNPRCGRSQEQERSDHHDGLDRPRVHQLPGPTARVRGVHEEERRARLPGPDRLWGDQVTRGLQLRPRSRLRRRSARSSCPAVAPPVAGSTTHPSAQALVADAEGFAVHASARHLRVPGPELRRSRPTRPAFAWSPTCTE